MLRVSIKVGGIQLPVLIITPLQVFVHPPLGIMPQIQIKVQHKVYSVHVLIRLWKRESYDTSEDVASLCKLIGKNTNFKFCPGISCEHYMAEYYEKILFHIKSVQLTEFPFT